MKSSDIKNCFQVMVALEQLASHQCSGSLAGSGSGWKCPCCDTISPTASAAQRHMDTHSGIKAFRCTICRYKGNTLRGMRTHIRMHFEKRTADLQVNYTLHAFLSFNLILLYNILNKRF